MAQVSVLYSTVQYSTVQSILRSLHSLVSRLMMDRGITTAIDSLINRTKRTSAFITIVSSFSILSSIWPWVMGRGSWVRSWDGGRRCDDATMPSADFPYHRYRPSHHQHQPCHASAHVERRTNMTSFYYGGTLTSLVEGLRKRQRMYCTLDDRNVLHIIIMRRRID